MSDISREAVAVALKQFALGVLSDYGVDADIPRNDPDFSDACFAEADAIWSVFTALEAQVAAADRLADAADRVSEWDTWAYTYGGVCPDHLIGCLDDMRTTLAAYRAAKGE